MRVALSIPDAYPLFEPSAKTVFGGAELHGSMLARGLAARGHDVNVLVHQPGDSDKADPSGEQTVDGVHVHPTAFPTNIAQRANARCANRIKLGGAALLKLKRFHPRLLLDLPVLALDGVTRGKLLSKPKRVASLVSMHQRDALDAVGAFGVHSWTHHIAFTARQLGLPVAIFLMDEQPFHASASGTERYRRILSLADVVVAQTLSQQRLLKERFALDGPLIRNPLPPSDAPLQAKRAFVFWIGRADVDGKRPRLCFDLARRCPDIPFVMVMNPIAGIEALHAEMKAEAPGNVKVIDRVPFEKIGGYYGKAAMFISTSAHEGFPNAFLQAAQHEAPVLSLSVDPDGVLSEQRIGLFMSDDKDKLAAEVQRLWADRDARDALGKKARLYVEEHHDPQLAAEQLEAVLEVRKRRSDEAT